MNKIIIYLSLINYIKMFYSLILSFVLCLHPFFVSLAEIKVNSAKGNMEVSVRIFTDDFEKALKASKLGTHDLSHPRNNKETEAAIDQYIQQHFYIEVRGKRQSLKMIGFEIDGDACWNYFEVPLEIDIKGKIHIHDEILTEAHPEEINLVHFIHGDKNLSTKLENPKWDFFLEI